MGITLVTGASGFVGAYLIQEMTLRALPVRAVSRHAQAGLISIPSYGLDMDWEPHFSDVDCIIHLAARVHVMRETAEDPLHAFREANVGATLHLAKQAAKVGVKRFVYVSTIKVNGEYTEPGRPFSWDDLPNPQDPYAVSKAEAEAALSAVGQETGMEIVIVRPPLVYGPGVGGNFRSLMRWAECGMPSVFAGVQNTRSLVYVMNLCDLLIAARTHPNAANRTFLVCDGSDFSTHELLSCLARAYGKKAHSIRVPLFVLRTLGSCLGRGDTIDRLVNNLQVDATATQQLLSWRCPVDSLNGLRATVSGNYARH